MTVYVARHGRSLGQKLFLGQSDPDLDDEGRRQSERLAAELADSGIVRIRCSTLERSAQTAAIVGKRLRLEVEQDARLRELSYGRWDGLAWDEIERRWPSEAASKLADWWGVTPGGGETRSIFHGRVRACWREIVGDARSTLIVGHSGVNGLLVELALREAELDWERVTRFEQGYGEALRVEVA